MTEGSTDERVLDLPCSRCHTTIRLPVREVIEAGGIGKVQHAPGQCPGEVQTPTHTYRMDVAITRDGEKLAGTGAEHAAYTIDVALEALLPKLMENWARMAGIATIAESEVIAEEHQAVVDEVMAEVARQESEQEQMPIDSYGEPQP